MHLSVEVTRACNYRCKYCGVDAGKPVQNQLSKKEIFNIIQRVKPSSFFILGGEPLLRKDVLEILDFAKKFCPVGIQTNGAFLTKEVAGQINADVINISVDGLPKVNAKLRHPKNFRHVEAAIRNLDKAGKLKKLRLCITVSKENLGEIDKIVRYFSPKIRKFGIGKLCPIGRADPKAVASRWETFKVYLKLLPLTLTNNIVFYSEFGGLFKVVVNGLTVLSDGSIIPCCVIRKPIGNIRTAKKLPRFNSYCALFMSGCAECKKIN